MLHPEYFLPNGTLLTIYNPEERSRKDYLAAQDQCLRGGYDPTSPRLPPFRHNQSQRSAVECLNVFLVILNAEIKFRRYFEMIRQHPPLTPLPADVLDLMHRTIDLVNLIYWRPVPMKGTKGYEELVKVEPLLKMKGQRVPLYDAGSSQMDDNNHDPT